VPPVTHRYPVLISWEGGREGSGGVHFANSGVQLDLAVPPEFGGKGGSTNPEELLTGAVASCYSITFGIVAANRKLPIQSLNVEAVGEVDQAGAAMTFKKITIKPTIVLASGSTEQNVAVAHEMALKADQYCIVTNTVREKVEVIVEPDVKVAP
jgi:peroxiredoxin-like protein